MKFRKILSAALALFMLASICVLFSSCNNEEAPNPAVAVSISTNPTYDKKEYTTLEKAAKIQNYIDSLLLEEEFSDDPENPDLTYGMIYTIIVTYENGEVRTFYQKGDLFFREDEGEWKKMNQDQGALLQRILDQNSSDK